MLSKKLEMEYKKIFGNESYRYFKKRCLFCDRMRLCYRIKGTNDFVCRNCADEHFSTSPDKSG